MVLVSHSAKQPSWSVSPGSDMGLSYMMGFIHELSTLHLAYPSDGSRVCHRKAAWILALFDAQCGLIHLRVEKLTTSALGTRASKWRAVGEITRRLLCNTGSDRRSFHQMTIPCHAYERLYFRKWTYIE
jgi:hypothetical protein